MNIVLFQEGSDSKEYADKFFGCDTDKMDIKSVRTNKEFILDLKIVQPLTNGIQLHKPVKRPLFTIVRIPDYATDFMIIETQDMDITSEYVVYCADGKMYKEY